MYEQEKTTGDPLENELAKEIGIRIVKNFLDLIILMEVRNKSGLSGYDIMILLNTKFKTLISSGTIYSNVYSLERKGLLKGISDERKTIFALTDQGEEFLNSLKNAREALIEFVEKFFSL